jgi:DNA-binding transcriptional regulator YhcF (GntR family)
MPKQRDISLIVEQTTARVMKMIEPIVRKQIKKAVEEAESMGFDNAQAHERLCEEGQQWAEQEGALYEEEDRQRG